MKKGSILKFLYSECVRIFSQAYIWVAIVGIAVIKFINFFGHPDIYQIIFEIGHKEGGLLNYDHTYARDTFFGYVAYCLAALPVVGGYIEDCKTRRLNVILTRITKLKYVIVRILLVVVISSMCSILGNILFMLLGHYVMNMAYVDETNVMFPASSFIMEGKWFLFWAVTELQNCMQSAFYALLAVAVSLFIRDKQFITVLPMLFRFVFVYFVNELTLWWFPQWISPRSIYIYVGGLFVGNDMITGAYAVFFTVSVAICVAFMMRVRLRKEL